MADRIHVDTEWLEKCARDLAGIENTIKETASSLAAIKLRKDEGGNLRTSLTISLKMNGTRFSGSNATDDIRQLQLAANSLAGATAGFSSAAKKAARAFEDAENKAVELVRGIGQGKDSEIYAKDVASAVTAGAMQGLASFFEGNKNNESQGSDKKAKEWGRKKGSIADVEYAFLCNAVMDATGDRNREEMKAYFLERLKDLPQNHPLRQISDAQVTTFSIYGVEGVIILLDRENAIVCFSGTDSKLDLIADLGIGWSTVSPAGRTFAQIAQETAANALIKNLENKGVSNIQVTGYSMGGYLAMEGAMHSQNVTRCVTFDSPKQMAADVLINYHDTMGKDAQEKYQNYIVDSSFVNKGGQIRPGRTNSVEVEHNWAGPAPDHQMIHIFEDGMGGMGAINRIWQRSGIAT